MITNLRICLALTGFTVLGACALLKPAVLSPLPPRADAAKITIVQYVPRSRDDRDKSATLPDEPVTLLTPAGGSDEVNVLLGSAGNIVNDALVSHANSAAAASVQQPLIEGVLAERIKASFTGAPPAVVPDDTDVDDGLKIEPFVHLRQMGDGQVYAVLVEYASLWKGGDQQWQARYSYHFPGSFLGNLLDPAAVDERAKFNQALSDGIQRTTALILSQLHGQVPAMAPQPAGVSSPVWADGNYFRGQVISDDDEWIVWQGLADEYLPSNGFHIFRKDSVKLEYPKAN